MPAYTCPRCHYTTKRKGNLLNHYKRKIPCNTTFSSISLTELRTPHMNQKHISASNMSTKCQPFKQKCQPFVNPTIDIENFVKVYKCTYCNKEFKHRQSKSRHESNNCKEKPYLGDMQGLVTELFSQLSEEREGHLKEKQELLNQMNQLINKTGNTTINNINNIDNIQNNLTDNTQNNLIDNTQNNLSMNNIQNNLSIENNSPVQNNKNHKPRNKIIRDYGDENMEHITHEFCKELLKEPYSGPNKLVRAIYFNPDYKENHNIKSTNKKLNVAERVKDGKWEYINKRTLLNREFIKTNKILDDCFNIEKDNMDKEFREIYERFQIARNELHHYNNTLCNIFVEILNGTNTFNLKDIKETLQLVC